MGHANAVKEAKSAQQLHGERSERGHGEVLEAARSRVKEAVEVEERVAEQLCHDDQVLLEVEVVEQSQDGCPALRIPEVDEGKDAHFAEASICAILVVAYNLDAHGPLAVPVMALPSRAPTERHGLGTTRGQPQHSGS